ncbi:MAG: SDR family NAD(P)-dependent oxidoreductase [bacterium]|nr:SDR family NAD(P)-dependent oxidoreductase [bacterium]
MGDRLAGRTVLVTGAARGIGYAICQRFAAEGARLALADIDADGVRAAAATLGPQHLAATLDVADVAASQARITGLIGDLGHLDILVNNAGYARYTTAFECTEADWDRMVDVNLKGVFFCAQAVLPHMRDRRAGNIVNMSSLAAKTGGVAAAPPYGAAKAGVSALTVHLAKVMAPFGVRVNALAPGVIDTDMVRGMASPGHADMARQIPLGQKGRAEDIANAALFLASDEASHITGEIVDVNGGLWMD